MVVVNPYLNFPGNTEEAFNFYKSVFGGEFLAVSRMRDIPDYSGLSEKDKNLIMHIALPLGKGNMLMGTDAVESLGHKLTQGNNFHITINTETKEEADKLFNGLSAGGAATMPMSDQFWGDYFGMLTDKYGINWMIAFTHPKK